MNLELPNIDISSEQKRKIPNLPFLQLKDEILGNDFELSISFVSAKTAKKINIENRQKDYIPNTLSFPYSEKSGEIFLQLETIYEQAPDFEMSEDIYLLFIYIHSLLHLKGLDHGSKMESLEKKYLKKYSAGNR